MRKYWLMSGGVILFVLALVARTQWTSADAPLDPPSLPLVLRQDPPVSPPPKSPAPENPMELTASDGTGLRLTRLSARSAVLDPLALTELHLAFENPTERVLEGQFRIRLPEGATLSRFAMKIGQRWQEGEVAPLEQARGAYEDALHRKQDPALLEHAQGNEFSARVFPIPARGEKELIVSYSQEIDATAGYILPLLGLPSIEKLEVVATRADTGREIARLQKTDYAPLADFAIALDPSLRHRALRHDRIVLTRVMPEVSSAPEEMGSLLVLLDTSASRGLSLDRDAAKLDDLLQRVFEHQPDAHLVVACFDQEIVPLFDGKAKEFGERELSAIHARRALGASDLERALVWTQEEAKRKQLHRVLLVSDGVFTAGATHQGALQERVRSLALSGVARFDALAMGGLRDSTMLHALASAGLPREGVVVAEEQPIARTAARLRQTVAPPLQVQVEGASWFWPQTIRGAQPGDEFLVYGELSVEHRTEEPLRVHVGDATTNVEGAVPIDKPLIQRGWAHAKIASLVARSEEPHVAADEKAELDREIVSLSMANRVLSPRTAMVVLESDRDYQRFGINRHALTDILTVTDGRIALLPSSLRLGGGSATEAKGASGQVLRADDRPTSKRRAAPTEDTGGAEPAPPAPRGDGERFAQVPPPSAGAPIAAQAAAPEANRAASPSLPSQVAPAPSPEPREQPRAEEKSEGLSLGRAGGGAASLGSRTGRLNDEATSSAAGHSMGMSDSRPQVARAARPVGNPQRERAATAPVANSDKKMEGANPYTGRYAEVMNALQSGRKEEALQTALQWQISAPGDVTALLALGESCEALQELTTAARAYGSIIDLFPGRADLRRLAGERLERLAGGAALDLAIDTYAQAKEQRPDHPSGHRLLAFARLRKGEYARAFDAALEATKRSFHPRFRGADRIVREDLGLIGAAWIKNEPARAEEIGERVRNAGGELEQRPSLRFVLNWETDANDVDFHIYDEQGNHAYYGAKELPTGGALYEDITEGYGPECFTIRSPRRNARYKLQANYYARGPMGYGMGKLEIVAHDGRGGLRFEERPFVIMADHAFVNLGSASIADKS